MPIVASIRGWDGTRVLGVFDSQELALTHCEAAGYDVSGENFHLDVTEMNKVSESMSLLVDASEKVKNYVKVHIYSSGSNSENMKT